MLTATRARPLAVRVVRQLAGVNILDLATRLAAQAFLAALPMLIAVASFCPPGWRRELRRSLRSLFGSGGTEASMLDQVYAGEPQAVNSWGAASVLVALLSATAFSRALQRLCERCWHLSPSGVRILLWRWALWLFVWLTALFFQGLLHDGFGAGPVLGIPLQAVGAVLMWWWTQHLLLAGRVPWRPLLPGALLVGSGVVVYSQVAAVWLPGALQRSVERYGPLGSVFTLLSWLIVFFTVVAVGIALGQVFAQEERVRRVLRIPAAEAGAGAGASEVAEAGAAEGAAEAGAAEAEAEAGASEAEAAAAGASAEAAEAEAAEAEAEASEGVEVVADGDGGSATTT
ncbi:YhjD/YihY/BrkB family envelope integrity protein [Streptomyces sp. Je 1-369]|uniref:YhjD/YihY/BrkB family envelope integrity protein n=1 Tax=Streptomyces sp. Je 1-369 TaxID=2966192 RepID=UPI002286BCB8|nr:YhjD/YihY/BrkB family envelope integrity protein [Streptomyces sp. Je 1-369]WAL96458.1 YihY/virulence factor BrkB family protein [Streptomyces sp. Je 1-369]